jgi:hypothetical protein
MVGDLLLFSGTELGEQGLDVRGLAHDDEDGPGRPFFYESILRAERQRLLTFYHLIFSFEPGLIASFQGDSISFMTLARFLRLFSCYGGSLSSQTSGADRPLPGAFPSFRQVPD